MDTICEVDESAAFRRFGWLGSVEWNHAFEHGQRNARADRTKGMAAVNQPRLGLDIAHLGFRKLLILILISSSRFVRRLRSRLG